MPHVHEKIDYAADTYIVNDNAVLLRMHEKYHQWFPPGGHIELDEDPAQAALREVKEEVGLDVEFIGDEPKIVSEHEREVRVPKFLNRHRINDVHEHISFVYFATSKTRDVVQGETEVSDHIKWFSREELEDVHNNIMERVRDYAKAALDAAAQAG